MSDRVRYTRQNIMSNNFYQLPKFLFDTEFCNLSNDARILYALLRNRHEISIKNGWYDEKDEVYLYFKREDMQTMLHLSDKTVTKAMKDLTAHRLLEEVRQGVSKPNRIYLLSASGAPLGIETAGNPDKHSDPENLRVMNRRNYESRTGNSTSQEPEKLRVNNSYNNTNHNNVSQPRKNRFANFNQRNWDYAAIEQMQQQQLMKGATQA